MTRRRIRRPVPRIDDLATHPEVHISLDALAAYWGLAVQTLRKWVRQGKLPAYRMGRALRVKVADAHALEVRAIVSRGTLHSAPE